MPPLPFPFGVDTGEPALDSELTGYRRIQYAPNRTLVYKVAA